MLVGFPEHDYSEYMQDKTAVGKGYEWSVLTDADGNLVNDLSLPGITSVLTAVSEDQAAFISEANDQWQLTFVSLDGILGQSFLLPVHSLPVGIEMVESFYQADHASINEISYFD